MAEKTAAIPQAVERALSEALGTIERQLGEVQASLDRVKEAVDAAGGQQSVEWFVRLLPPLMHMQASGAALAASIESMLRFVGSSAQWSGLPTAAVPMAAPPPAATTEAAPAQAPAEEEAATAHAPAEEPAPVEAAPAGPPPVDIESLPEDMKALHKKAKRFAKITVQELLMYHKNEVEQGRQNKDLYKRLKDDIDKSKALYDQRYQKIADHHIDYLYDEFVRVLAENDASALGDYPYVPPPAHS